MSVMKSRMRQSVRSQRGGRRGGARRLVVWFLALMSLGYLVLNLVLSLGSVRRRVAEGLGESTDFPLAIRALSWWPPFLPLTAEGVSLEDTREAALPVEPELRRVSMSWDWAQLVRGKFMVADLKLSGPAIYSKVSATSSDPALRKKLAFFSLPVSSLLRALKPGAKISGGLDAELNWSQQFTPEDEAVVTLGEFRWEGRTWPGVISMDFQLMENTDILVKNVEGQFPSLKFRGQGSMKPREEGAPMEFEAEFTDLLPSGFESLLRSKIGAGFYGGSWNGALSFRGSARDSQGWDVKVQFSGQGSVLRLEKQQRAALGDSARPEWRVNLIRGQLLRGQRVWRLEGFEMDCEPLNVSLSGTMNALNQLDGKMILRMPDETRAVLENLASNLKLPPLTFVSYPELRRNGLALELSGTWPQIMTRWREDMEPVPFPFLYRTPADRKTGATSEKR